MTKNVIAALLAAAGALLRRLPALAVLAALYALFIAACYFFITTREATTLQVVGTVVFFVAVPVLFFVWQGACAGFAVGADTPGAVLQAAARNFGRVFVASLPLILLAALCGYLLHKAQVRLTAQVAAEEQAQAERSEAEDTALSVPLNETAREAARKPKVRWAYVLLVTGKLLVFGLLLPVLALSLWLGVARAGLRGLFKGFGRVLAPQTVLTYAVGLVIFGVIPYFLLFTRTPVSSAWLELTLFGLRLLLAFLFTLFGWVLTMRALAGYDAPPASPAAAATAPAAPPQPTPAAA